MPYRRNNAATPPTLLLAGAAAGVLFAARTAVRFSRRIDFRGRTVLITGGSRGLGLLLARHLGREGAKLVLLARDEDELDRAKDDLWRIPAEVLTIRCDVTTEGEVDEAVRRATEHFGRIDVLINNAGIITVGPMELMTLADYADAMKVHFWGPLYTTLAVLPQMRIRGEGRIVNISSIGGKVPVPHLAPYCASKFALTGW
jgi:NAD(P)-dependent dehydrogenase (short-subunit alcohol dehydrogenase family)